MRHFASQSRQKGLTLIELMIALILAFFVLGASITIFVNSVRSNVDHIKMLRLNQDMRAVMAVIKREVKMAGSDQSAIFTQAVPALEYDCVDCELENPTVDDFSSVSFAYISYDQDTNEYFRQARAFAQSAGNAVLMNGQPLSAPEHTYQKVLFEVDDLVENGEVVGQSVDITLSASTDLAGGQTASRTLFKTVRVRN